METPRYRHSTEVAFGDTDASGWMHFPNIFRYFEEAEHAFLRSLGLLVFDRSQGGWPRVKVGCDFKKPLLTGDKIEVLLDISRVGASSVTWDFQVRKEDGDELAAFGNVTTVRVDHQGRPVELSPAERSALSPATA